VSLIQRDRIRNKDGPDPSQPLCAPVNAVARIGEDKLIRDVADMEMLRDFWLACNPPRDADPDLFRFLIDTRLRGIRRIF
jgi:hypothetical protein